QGPENSARETGRATAAGPAIPGIDRTGRRGRVRDSELRDGVPDAVGRAGRFESGQRERGHETPLRTRCGRQEQTSVQPAMPPRAAIDRIRRAFRGDRLSGSSWDEQWNLGPAF